MDMSVIMLDSLRWGGGRILWRVREKGGSDEPPEPPPWLRAWYMNTFIWITVSSSGARHNDMLRERNIQEVVFYFVEKDKLML